MIGIDPTSRKLLPIEPPRRLDFVDLFLQRERETAKETALVPLERSERHILLIRGQKVLLDSDLAELYGVSTKILNQAVKRNRSRFLGDFMFQLTTEEARSLRSQFVTLKRGEHRKYRPYAFTEQGVAMLSSVLRSKRAVQVNVQIMRTFVRLREMFSSNAALAKRLDELEKKYDRSFRIVFDAIRQLMAEPEESEARPRIGYTTEERGRAK